MGLFDGLVEASFKKTKDGRTAFYPHGLGSGYILTTNHESAVRRLLRIYYMILFPLCLAAGSIFGLYGFAILPISLLFYYLLIIRFLRGSEKIDERLSYKDTTMNIAKAMGIPVSIFLFILCTLITVFSAYLIFIGITLHGTLGLLFFSFLSFSMFRIVKYSINSKEKLKTNP